MHNRLDEIITQNMQQLMREPCIWWQKTWWSRGAFMELIEACEESLVRSRFKSGQRLALLLPNSPMLLALCVAVWRIGGTVVPIDYRGGYVAIIKQLKHADVFAAITFRGFASTVPLISEEGIPCVVTPLDEPVDSIAGRSSEEESPETAVIFYTSGTTGDPKAVPITHENILSNIEACTQHIGELTEEDVFLNALPNYNALGFVCAAMLPLVSNIRQVVLQSFMPPESTMDAMKQGSVSIVPAVPTMLALLFGAAGRGFLPPKSLRFIISGGDRLPPEFEKRAEAELGVPVLEGYGLTEASAVVSINPGVDRRKPGTVGTLLCNLEGEIRDDDGTVLPAGKEGSLWLRGSSMASSYYRNPELTAERFVDGWFDTRDIAKFDEDGYLSLVSRLSEVIFVGGFKVYAQEVERVLAEHPAVAEVAVVGVPRSISGELVKAYVVLKKGEKVSARDLIEFSRKKLSYYKVPRIVEFVSEMPRSSIGEILKRKLGKE
ncbi:AMP-binding protein [Synergistaceae bacterium OttesenSCG-928-D05]|nr:AMP-binding protein [Synergistaceae bacterium OttesenSCG-928-D05]